MILYTEINVSYLPQPNKVEFILSDELAPVDLTSTAFMVPVTRSGLYIAANNHRRGVEIPGGHIERGETPCSAAHREAVEEAGAWCTHIRALGYLKMTSQGQVPADWKYPHPLGYQQFFAGEVLWFSPYQVNDECDFPGLYTIQDAQQKLKPNMLAIYEAARQKLFPGRQMIG